MIKFRVKQEPPTLDDASLIEKVKQHEFLYNMKHTDYRNLPLRASVWSSITDNLGIRDQNVTQKRWKVLREKFSVAYRKYNHDGTTPSWSLYEMCSFLAPYVNLKPDTKKDDRENEEQSLLIERRGPPKSPFDETLLIHLIRERPVLYDKQHEEFRSSNTRKKTWIEVARTSGWDIATVQKRWRVMRDRFVRELRRTKNIDTDSHVNCSSFFRDMLFLVRHVKSKNYEAEATDLSDASEERWEDHEEPLSAVTRSKPTSRIKGSTTPSSESVKTETMQLMDETVDSNGRMVYASTNDNSSYVECYESGDAENEVYCDGPEYVENAEEYFDEDNDEEEELEEEALETVSLDQSTSVADVEDVATNQDIQQEINDEQWFKAVSESSSLTVKKRQASFCVEDEPPEKKPFLRIETPFTLAKQERVPVTRSEQSAETVDEDASFGQTIGLMLKKIPTRLKTSVKLKILQSIADFEIQHNLV